MSDGLCIAGRRGIASPFFAAETLPSAGLPSRLGHIVLSVSAWTGLRQFEKDFPLPGRGEGERNAPVPSRLSLDTKRPRAYRDGQNESRSQEVVCQRLSLRAVSGWLAPEGAGAFRFLPFGMHSPRFERTARSVAPRPSRPNVNRARFARTGDASPCPVGTDGRLPWMATTNRKDCDRWHEQQRGTSAGKPRTARSSVRTARTPFRPMRRARTTETTARTASGASTWTSAPVTAAADAGAPWSRSGLLRDATASGHSSTAAGTAACFA